MPALTFTLSILLGIVLLTIAAQEFRYLRTRRNVVGDRQPLLHSPQVFHVATILQLAPGQELLGAVRGFVGATERAGGTVVYAGKVAVNAMASSQLPDVDWEAFVLAQFPTRAAYDAAAASPDLQKSRAGFAHSYALGMQRSRWLNLAVPIILLAIRVRDVVTRHPARYPFRPATAPDGIPTAMLERRARLVEGLLANREYGEQALVVLNFVKNGTPEQRAANAGYGAEMFGLMAEMGNGPMHIGRAVTLEGDADFDQVIIVYYPGVAYFAELVQSAFFTGIVGGKQLGDTLSSPTVPLLPHL